MNISKISLSIAGTIIRIAVLIFAVSFIIKAGKATYEFGYRILSEESVSEAPGTDILITIAPNMDDEAIGQLLVDKGLIRPAGYFRDSIIFEIQKKLSKREGDIPAGIYTLNTSQSIEEMIAVFYGDDEEDSESEEKDEESTEEQSDVPVTGLESGGVLSEETVTDDAYAGEGEAEEDTTESEKTE